MQVSVLMAVLLQVSGVWSALPPWAVQSEKYEACLAQAKAPEVVRIEILRVRRKFVWCGPSRFSHHGSKRKVWRWQGLSVDAKIIAVHKSNSGLKVGSRIHFDYSLSRLCPGMVGAANRPQVGDVSKGVKIWGFFRHLRGKRYSLAAGAFSLEMKLPAIKSVKQWEKQCDMRYRGRRRP